MITLVMVLFFITMMFMIALILGPIPGQDDICDYLGQGPILPLYIVSNHPIPNPFPHDDDDDDDDVVHDRSYLRHLLPHDVVL
jgi:hypothetical protein